MKASDVISLSLPGKAVHKSTRSDLPRRARNPVAAVSAIPGAGVPGYGGNISRRLGIGSTTHGHARVSLMLAVNVVEVCDFRLLQAVQDYCLDQPFFWSSTRKWFCFTSPEQCCPFFDGLQAPTCQMELAVGLSLSGRGALLSGPKRSLQEDQTRVCFDREHRTVRGTHVYAVKHVVCRQCGEGVCVQRLFSMRQNSAHN